MEVLAASEKGLDYGWRYWQLVRKFCIMGGGTGS